MAYHVSLVIDTGAASPTKIVDLGSYTSNCRAMFIKATEEKYEMLDLYGMPCMQAFKIIARALWKFRFHRDEYKARNPENGFGDLESFEKFLLQLHDACKEHRKCSIFICS